LGVFFGAVSVLLLLAASRADAAPGWLAPVDLSGAGHRVSEPRVVFDKQDDAVAVWSSEDGIQADGTTNYEVRAAFKPAGGAWQAPETLSMPGQSASQLRVAFDGQGDVIVVWDSYDSLAVNARFRVQSAFKPAGGYWQAPVYLSSEKAPGAGHPQVAVDEHGDAMAVWNVGGDGAVQEAFRPEGGAWQAPVEIAELGEEPQVAFDAKGDALVLWSRVASYSHYVYEYIVQSAFRPVDGTWQAPVDVSALGFAGELHVLFDEQGNATATWTQWSDGFLSPRVVQTAVRPANGTWQAPTNLTTGAEDLGHPVGAQDPVIAVDAQGNALAVWCPGASGCQDEIIYASYKPAGGIWQPAVDLSGVLDHAYALQIIFDGQGDALVSWASENGIQVASYVAHGPTLNDVSIPATGTVGQPLTFSVSPFDVWSILGETSWSFGDGASASSASVTHTYTAPGVYEVTLHSADTLGNVTSTSGTITITPAPHATTTPSSSFSEPSSDSPTSEPPVIGIVSQSASVWRERGKSRVGTMFSISLNEQATIGLSFLRHVNGREVGGKCLATTPRNAGHRVCGRAVIAGALSFPGHKGTNTAGFQGFLLPSKKLKPGRYTLVITATNGAGQHSNSKSLNFTIRG
jgi:hypothetical protein